MKLHTPHTVLYLQCVEKIHHGLLKHVTDGDPALPSTDTRVTVALVYIC